MHKPYSIRLLFSLLFIPFSIITSLAGNVSGIVLDEKGILPLPGAGVQIKELSRGKICDSRGQFFISNVKSGSYTLTVTSIGFKKYSQKIEIPENGTISVKVLMQGSTSVTNDVIVMGDGLQGQARALNQQKEGISIANIISSDQVGRFPDANVGDALKRVQGITVQYDQGEARFGLIRGTAARLNSVTINGDRIPSAEAENREVQLDLIPSDMIQTIEVTKALTPDMDADAIGGSINLITRGAPETRRLSITGAGGYNFLSEKPILTGAGIYGERFMDNKLGLVLSGSINNHKLASDNVEAEWEKDANDNAYVSDLQLRRYDVERTRRSISLGLDYKFDEQNQVFFNTIYNWRDDWENRYRVNYRYPSAPDSNGIVSGAEVRRETKGGIGNDRVNNTRLEDQRTFNVSFSGQHLLGAVKANWQANYAKASEERPNERYVSFRTRKQKLTQDISDPIQPKGGFVSGETGNDLNTWTLRQLTEQYGYTEDVDLNAKLDLETTLNQGAYESILKGGIRYRGKEKMRDNSFNFYTPNNTNVFNSSSFGSIPLIDMDRGKENLAGDYAYGSYAPSSFLGGINVNDTSNFKVRDGIAEYVPGNFNATETINAGYLMLTQQMSGGYLNSDDKLMIVAGARVEHTSVEYTGNSFDADAETYAAKTGTNSYLNILPSLHVRYEYNPALIIRMAYTNTIARPNYYNLVPYQLFSQDDDEITLGNPDLKATTSSNLDLMAEYYFESVGIFSGGIFQKNIQNFIYDYILRGANVPLINGVQYARYTQPRNGAEATITGMEFGFQRQLDFLPGILGNTSLYLNYTNTGSNVPSVPTDDTERIDAALPGTAEHMFNASLSYEDSKLSARISVNYTSAYIDSYGVSEFYDRYYDTQTFVDFNAAYKITPQLRMFAELNNITNQPLRYYQGISERTMQSEFYNMRMNVGLKWDL
ncbi:MAG: TonB-dependent receptor [Ignavibacteria bacterium]|jgi:TonB-dependent receptor